MHSETLTYTVDGLSMRSDLFVPESGTPPRPGVLVFSDAFGIGLHSRTRAQMIANLGYVALACDLWGEAKAFGDVPTMMTSLEPLLQSPGRTRALVATGLDALAARPEVDANRIAAIGFCFGGTMALELARSGAQVRGVVGFHSGLTPLAPKNAHNIKGKVLVFLGAEDPVVPAEQRAAFEAEMRDAGVDWQMTLYGGVVHSFTNPDVAQYGATPDVACYDANADARSWAEMRHFFEEIFVGR